MLKKLIATALAAAMVLGLVSVGFAAGTSFKDIENSPRKGDILKLAALGIIDGYPDGTFKPNNTITRAEFAKIIVTTLGLGEAANVMSGVPTAFPDVPADHWAAGYINVASSRGIVNGYEDGTFRPGNSVTYAEALKMILCAIGYTPEVFKTVVWPVTWISQGVRLGVTQGVNVFANLPATRGDIAALVENALTVDKVVQTGFGDQVKYEVKEGENLLKDLIGTEPVTGFLVDSPELFANDGKTIKLSDNNTNFTVLNPEDVKGLLGHKVKVWANSDNEVLFIEDLTPADSIKKATYVAADRVKIDTKEVGVTNVPRFRNYDEPDATVDLQNGDEITVIYEGSTIKYIVALGYETGVVNSVSTAYQKIYFSESTRDNSIRLSDLDKVTFVGAASNLSELKKGDVVQYILGTNAAVLVVTRDAYVGKLTKITSGQVATVGGKDYKFAAPVTDPYNTFKSLLGQQVKILLNKDGKIVSMEATTEEGRQAAIAAVLAVGQDNFDEPMVKVLRADGTTAVLNFASGVDASCLGRGSVIEYTLDSDGNIDSVTEVVYGDFTQNTYTVDADLHLLDNRYVMTGDTVCFKYTYDDRGTLTGIKLISRADVEANESITGTIKTSGGKVSILVMTGGELGTTTEKLGMVVGEYLNADKDYVLSVLAKGTVSDYVYGDTDPGIDEGTIISFSLAGSDTFDTITPVSKVALPEDASEYRVIDVDPENSLVTVQAYNSNGDPVGDPVDYVVTGDTLYFDVTGEPVSISLEDLSVNAVVDLYVESAGSYIVSAIVVTE